MKIQWIDGNEETVYYSFGIIPDYENKNTIISKIQAIFRINKVQFLKDDYLKIGGKNINLNGNDFCIYASCADASEEIKNAKRVIENL